MNGTIVSYRRSMREITGNQAIVKVDSIKNREEAKAFVGKSVVWQSTKNAINGKVASPHGNGGKLRILFERGIPGQAITTTVEIK